MLKYADTRIDATFGFSYNRFASFSDVPYYYIHNYIQYIGGTEADFQVAIQENCPPLHDQKKFFLSNAPIYKVYIHRSILTSRSSPRATYRRDRMDKAL